MVAQARAPICLPLLKVTHTPTLQARIIDAAARGMECINPTLEGLIFSIYCVSVLSLSEDKCRTLFASSRKDLPASYQFARQQALLGCRALQSGDRDSLTRSDHGGVPKRLWFCQTLLSQDPEASVFTNVGGCPKSSTFDPCEPLRHPGMRMRQSQRDQRAESL